MKQIRSGVFETNSSSMHSLVIKNDELLYDDDPQAYIDDFKEVMTCKLNKKKFWDASHEDWYFGRYPFEILSSAIDKIKYALANYCWSKDFEAITAEIEDYIRRYVPDLVHIHIPADIGTDDALLKSWLEKNNISLEDFIFDPRYVVICDGDEYCMWDQLKNSGIIDKTGFKEV